ncbi:MAG: NADH-quinone oxidoreductase subunit L [Burkholderiaceae bacterium]|nr:NADH-quinone oxidoreductase subunit L [Burkholderiaceae bacterium]
MKTAYLLAAFAPLVGALVAGLFGARVGRANAHRVTILGVAVSLAASVWTLTDVLAGHTFNGALYTWSAFGDVRLEIGFLVDSLTATMMCVVTFVSLMVHIYTIGYMAEDPGYQRFFSYISLFTFSMMMLVMANNFLQLFFGWEAVGLVSYLLIGFWYTRPTAIYANLKAFLVNRVGDFGFALGIGLVLAYFGSLDYATVFKAAPGLADRTINLLGAAEWSLLTVTCICLFIGAMGKSAQFPLHVWLPDSMEGPTPISALIHAATMVTAGIFMVSRMSPLFELSDTALGFVMVIGGITALFMGFLGIIQNDIKRVVAYSTLSQLGYMTVALGASAYSAAIFHLMTHAFFKALLFLAAGSVIIGMHHDQDIRNMGGLRRYMPITWLTSLVGSLALIGTPFLSGFYSKDSIIEAAKVADVPGAGFGYFAVMAGVFVTAFYSFRMYFLVFHGKSRWGQGGDHAHGHDDAHGDDHHHGLKANEVPHESPAVVTLPLVLLAIPSVIIGLLTAGPMLFGGFLEGPIVVANRHGAMAELAHHWHGWMGMGMHAFGTPPFWLALAGVVSAYYCYMINPALPEALKRGFGGVYRLLENKYYMDRINEIVFAGGSRLLGRGLWRAGDQGLIDGLAINGSARLVGWFAGVLRGFQTGRLNTYAITMIIGVAVLLGFVIVPLLRH